MSDNARSRFMDFVERRFAEGGEISDEEYDARLLSRMKRDTGRTTEPTRAEQMQALRTAGREAGQLAADVLLPQSPLDAALMVALGPGGRLARIPAAAALAAAEPSEAEASRLLRFIRAYHGSPYAFERFDLSKVGTGTGAKTYGQGVNLSESENLARGYRDRLTPFKDDIRIGQYEYSPIELREYRQSPEYLDRDLQRAREYLEQTRQLYSSPRYRPEERQMYIDAALRPVLRLEALQSVPRSALPDIPTGHIYEVDVRARPQEFLNWDETLARQTPEVRGALQRFNLDVDPSYTGRDIYRRSLNMTPEEASGALREAGVPGVRYTAPGSADQGGIQNYVVFDPEIIDIQRRFATGGLALLDDED